jgi:hypothetical protein
VQHDPESRPMQATLVLWVQTQFEGEPMRQTLRKLQVGQPTAGAVEGKT